MGRSLAAVVVAIVAVSTSACEGRAGNSDDDAGPVTTEAAPPLPPVGDSLAPGMPPGLQPGPGTGPYAPPGGPARPPEPRSVPCPPIPVIDAIRFTAEQNPAAPPNEAWIVDVRGTLHNPSDERLVAIITLHIENERGDYTRMVRAGVEDERGYPDATRQHWPPRTTRRWGYEEAFYVTHETPGDRPGRLVARLEYSHPSRPACNASAKTQTDTIDRQPA